MMVLVLVQQGWDTNMTERKKKPKTIGKYTISKPGDQWVVKDGNDVVFADPSADKCEEYVYLMTRG